MVPRQTDKENGEVDQARENATEIRCRPGAETEGTKRVDGKGEEPGHQDDCEGLPEDLRVPPSDQHRTNLGISSRFQIQASCSRGPALVKPGSQQ